VKLYVVGYGEFNVVFGDYDLGKTAKSVSLEDRRGLDYSCKLKIVSTNKTKKQLKKLSEFLKRRREETLKEFLSISDTNSFDEIKSLRDEKTERINLHNKKIKEWSHKRNLDKTLIPIKKTRRININKNQIYNQKYK
jgi:hypothetical protein